MRAGSTSPDFDRIARPYRWLEYLSFGPLLEWCRFYRLPELADARRALVLGDGDGRFLGRLLKSNPQLRADALDLSPAMLKLLGERAAEAGALDRVTLHCADARDFTPAASYDLVVTHFFLDCFTTDELRALVGRIRSHLTPDARWVVSEFAIPRGLISLPPRLLVRTLYIAFGLLTGLEVRRLPDYPAALEGIGLSLRGRRGWLGGMLVSDLWESAPTNDAAGSLHPQFPHP
jgi:SAM-dependent methyltransferase